jgi:amino acid permease
MICLAVYLSVGILGYLTWGNEAKGNILLNYPEKYVAITIGFFFFFFFEEK